MTRPNSYRYCDCAGCAAFNEELLKLGSFPEGGGWDPEAEVPVVTPEQDTYAHQVWVLTAKHPCDLWPEEVRRELSRLWPV